MSKPDKKKKQAEEPAVDGEGAEGEEGEGAAKKKGLPIMLIAIIAGAVLLLGGGGAAVYFLFLAPKHPPAAEAGKAGEHGKDAKDEKGKEKKKEEKGGHGEKKEGGAEAKVDPATIPQRSEGPDGIVYYKLPSMVANIQSADGHPVYLQVQLTFECPDEDVADELDTNMPRINDLLQGFVRELRAEDLSGSQANYLIRLEILRRVNLVLAPNKINAVLFQQMVVK